MTDFVVTASATFDTNLDANCNGGVVNQAGGPAICVVRYRKIEIHSNVDLRVVGTRALALVSDEVASIAGYLDVSARDGQTYKLSGPGGGTSQSGCTNTQTPSGYGGAGFATQGGNGGSSSANGGANNGGVVSPNPATLDVLIGGPHCGPTDGFGGGGGGALTVVSCRGTVDISGEINAGGGGGVGAFIFIVAPPGGGGGGAGGNVVLQGLRISVTGKLFANGGGGGGGFTATGQVNGGPGFDGSRSAASAQGGTSAGGALGGVGSAQNGLPGPGRMVGTSGGTAGGGGGSVGFLQTYTPTGIDPTITPSLVSPPMQVNANVPTR